ncbi:MAG: cbb3-type cytochrome oxidase assembly protein CcoS [Gammaproteobacteria bacterium]|nr:cbb3-type cytochrome oxidase assembly protein CcoS [Gammaproteobacteria bacterium]MDH5729306.1 cbb3-type cytochrome oxidase assembly protein CcoS [Gammaproteobacteria bacterium]
MEVIYGLIPGMIILGLIMVGILVWSVKQGHYDDLEGEASRILFDDDEDLMPFHKDKITDSSTKKSINLD